MSGDLCFAQLLLNRGFLRGLQPHFSDGFDEAVDVIPGMRCHEAHPEPLLRERHRRELDAVHEDPLLMEPVGGLPYVHPSRRREGDDGRFRAQIEPEPVQAGRRVRDVVVKPAISSGSCSITSRPAITAAATTGGNEAENMYERAK